MLKSMRHHAKYFYVLFFIVILTFIFWGVGTVDKSTTGDIVAEVGPHKITRTDYGLAYDRLYKFYRDLYKEKFDEAMQKQLNLQETALNNLITNRVLQIAAAENGIAISDAELREAIMNEPSFMSNGVFDESLYQNTLRLNRLPVETYETMKRQELLLKKMADLIGIAAPVPELPQIAGLNADDQMLKSLRDSVANDAREKALKAYVEGYKKKIKITINQQNIS
ncbi:MAG: SurA N-terminal domain-containing protein [Thermodesulfovibrionales bacterium]